MKPAVAAIYLAAGLFLAVPRHALAEDTARSKQQIEAVVEAFRTAIIRKDKDAFMTLFLKEDITWTSATTDASLDMLYATRPDPSWARPPKVRSGKPGEMIDFIVKDPAKLEETFSNVRIDTDGEIAQVWFDYSFMVGNHKQNWGKESWQLVRTESGWKIAAVVWSQELSPVPPPKP